MREKIKTLATREEIKKLATKAELKAEQDNIVKPQTYDLSLFICQNYCGNDEAQLYLILQPLYYNLKGLGDSLKKLYHGNLLLLLMIIVFLHQLNGNKVQSFV